MTTNLKSFSTFFVFGLQYKCVCDEVSSGYLYGKIWKKKISCDKRVYVMRNGYFFLLFSFKKQKWVLKKNFIRELWRKFRISCSLKVFKIFKGKYVMSSWKLFFLKWIFEFIDNQSNDLNIWKIMPYNVNIILLNYIILIADFW